MDELLEELNVSFDDLFKIHTGHHLFNESDDSDSSEDSSSLDENIVPPLYTLDEISKNLVTVGTEEHQKGFINGEEEHTEKTVNSSKISNPQAIAKKLSLYLTRKYCFICKKGGGGSKHYQVPAHYHKVKNWLRQELASVLGEAQLSDFYCPICNLPLNGYSLFQEHFESKDHITKIENFCLSCLRPVLESGMSEHMKSKTHLEHVHATSKLFLEINLKLKLNREENKNVCPSLNLATISNNADDDQNDHTRSSSDTKCKIIQESQSLCQSEESVANYKNTDDNNLDIISAVNNVHQSNTSKHPNLTEYGVLANIIIDLLGTSFCYVCKINVNGTHYSQAGHNKELEKWIQSYTKSHGFLIKNIDDLICFACHAVFPKRKYAEMHYESAKHKSKSENFCKVCLQHLVGKQVKNHYTQAEHTEERNRKVTEMKQNIMDKNKAFNAEFSDRFVQWKNFNSIKIHGIDVNVIKAIIEEKMDIITICEPVVREVLELMTPTYCFICNKSALKNGRGVFRHYTYQTHIKELKELLHDKVKDKRPEKINYVSLYCEPCNHLCLNLKLAEQHYNTILHRTKCEYCKFHGSNTLNDNSLADNKENASSTSKKNPGTVIAEKLKEMISPTYCYICERKCNMHIFNHHYLEKGHVTKVRTWLDKEIKKLELKIDRRILYCEECSLELKGTKKDLKHYKTLTHQSNAKTYCSVCIFRGTSNNIREHMASKSHKNQLKQSSSTKIENVQRNLWPKKLTSLITLTECKVCCVKLETTKKADFHYCSDIHNINVENWIDNYFLSDDFDNVAENSKQFSCTFCNNNFSSEMELNEHNNIHFPALGGSGYSKKSKAKSDISKTRSQRKKSQELSEKTITDTQAKATFEQQISGSEEENKSIYNIKLEATQDELPYETNTNKKYEHINLYEAIRTEINKLIETLYFSKALPLEQSLNYLKDLNKKLNEASLSITEENNQEIKSGTSNPQITKLEYPNLSLPNEVKFQQEYAKTKLSMELYRLKMVLGNTYKISTDSALKYVQNLNDLIEISRTSGPGDFDINILFEDGRILEGPDLKNKLENELSNLSCNFLDDKKIDVQVALDIITRFNVQLESLLEYHEVNISYDSDY